MLSRRSSEIRQNEQGFLLLAVVIAVAVILILLAVAAPRMAKQLQRDKEEESIHRAEQYRRAIQLYYRSVNTYPTSIDQLMNTNNRKFLRQKYKDPLTGDDYRLIHLGEQKTKIRWFFGKSMDEIMPGGLSGMAGMGSPIGGSPIAGSSTPGQSIGSASGTPGSPATPGAPGQTSSSPFGSQDATTFQGSTGPIIGVGTKKKGDALVEWNGSKKMQDWEFLYDPRPDMIRNQVSLFGGSPAVGAGMQGGSMGGAPIGGGGSLGSGGPMGGAPSSNGGFGSPASSSSPFGGSSSGGFGSSPFGGSNGSGFGSSSGLSGSSGSAGTSSGATGNGASTPPQ